MTDYISKPSPEELVLKHYGVKGMRWGVRRTEKQLSGSRKKSPENMTSAEKAARIKKLHKELQKMNPELGLAGAGVRGHYGKKLSKKDFKKNPDYDWRKESPEKRLAISKQVTNKATRGTIYRAGAVAAAGILGAKQAKRINLSNPSDTAIVQAGVKALGVGTSLNAIVGGAQTVRGIRQEGREYEIRVELTALGDKKHGR
jgi:hypothetical protein